MMHDGLGVLLSWLKLSSRLVDYSDDESPNDESVRSSSSPPKKSGIDSRSVLLRYVLLKATRSGMIHAS